MKNILLFLFIFELLIPFAFSQSGDHNASSPLRGGRYTKTVEYNLLRPIIGYNYNSKDDVEKLFFGDFNAPVEFFFDGHDGEYYGFRIVRDTLKMSYFLEIKYISNDKEARNEASRKYPLRGISSREKSSIPKDSLEQIMKQNIENREKYFEERNKLFKIESRSFSISDKFAEKMYEKMVSVIDNFKARGVPPFINGGYSVTFRAAVDDNELWTLKIHVPTGNALKWSDFCIQIVKEKDSKKIKESTYIKLLDDF